MLGRVDPVLAKPAASQRVQTGVHESGGQLPGFHSASRSGLSPSQTLTHWVTESVIDPGGCLRKVAPKIYSAETCAGEIMDRIPQ